jgi:hypothetical protein
MKKVFQQISKMFGDIPWMVFGGYNLKLQGLAYESNDIDIVTTKKGIEKILQSTHAKETNGDNWKGCKLSIDGQTVEIITEENFTQQFYQQFLETQRINKIYFNGIIVPCLMMTEQLKGYEAVKAAGKGSNDPEPQMKGLRKYVDSNKFTPEQWYVAWRGIFEDNLLPDLQRLVINQPQQKGGLNFVIVLMCMVTMDLLGKLISGSNHGDAIRVFLNSDFFKVPKAYDKNEFANVINTELRNNLAHAFFPDKNIAIGRNTSSRHFDIVQVGETDRKLFWIDADELFNHLLKSLEQYKKILIEDKKIDGERYRALFVQYVNNQMLNESGVLKNFMDKYYSLDPYNHPLNASQITHTTTLPPENE